MTEACLANIDAAGRRRRFLTGVFVLAVTLTLTLLLGRGSAPAWRLLALPPLAFGWLCVTQALANT